MLNLMKKRDGRKLKTEAQQEVRYLAIELYIEGIKQNKIAEMIGISSSGVNKYIKIYKTDGVEGLVIKKQGVKEGTNRKLNFEQAEFLKQIIISKTPEKIGLNYSLWTRQAIQLAVINLLDIFIPLRTISH